MSDDTKIYYDDWEGYTDEEMLSDWGKKPDALEGCEVLFGSYQYECYEGSAWVIFAKGGQLFEVNGGHCSCYGLSERGFTGESQSQSQWDPEEVTIDALRHRVTGGYLFRDRVDAINQALDMWEDRQSKTVDG